MKILEYHFQLGHLSAQERKAVRTLADLDHAVSVRDLAEELATDQRSVSKTITTLRRSGWIVEVRSVIAGGDGRLTYYELAEPLARLAFQIKDNRGEPLPMLVSLLSLWFSRDELNAVEPLAMSIGSRSYLAAASTGSELATHELAMGLGGSARSMVPDPLLLALADALEAAHGGEPERFFALPSTVRCLAERSIKDVGLEATWRNTIALSSGLPVWVSRVEALVRQGTNSLSNRSLLARLLVIAGRPTEAVALYKHILGECEQTLDANNQNTLETKGNLANAYWSDGRIADAIAVLEQLLPQSESTFGPQHPETLKVIGSLGNAYRSADRLAEAITLLDRAVVESERILGVDHPDTLISRQNLGVAYVSAGRIATANVLFDTLLKTADRILGTNHPKTLAIAHNLAVTYWMDERLEDSTRLLREVIDGRCLTLGPNHGDTLLSCFVLQLIQAELGRAEAT